ncbi:DMT family transporter [Halovulum sp. GXIMD14793]
MSTATTRPDFAVDNLRGIGWILLSVAASSAMTVAVRAASLAVDSRMVVLLRAGITLLVLLAAILLVARLRRQLRFTRPWLHVTRGAMIAISTHLGFYTIAKIPLTTVTVLFFMAPIFATILSALYQKEKVGPRRIAAIAVGFTGALIIIRPGFGTLHPAMLTALLSSILFAAALIQSRGVAEADGSFSALFSSVLVTVIISIPLAAPVFALPTAPAIWAFVALLVITGAIRNVADIEAYRHGEAAVIAPFTYLRLIFIGIAAYWMFDEVPDRATLIGGTIIIAATLYIAQRETQLRKRAKPATGP